MLPLAFFWSSDTQCLAFWKDSAFVMSYTTAAAEAPLHRVRHEPGLTPQLRRFQSRYQGFAPCRQQI